VKGFPISRVRFLPSVIIVDNRDRKQRLAPPTHERIPTRGYRDLIVWQKAMKLVPEVYRQVRKLPAEERYGLADQLRRAAVSVAANIAEGQARQSGAEFARHLTIARGSLAEVDTLLLVGVELGYFAIDELEAVFSLIIDVRRLLQALIQALEKRRNPK
jgi:four helix bundle protein